MPNLENLKKQAKQYLRWHRERYYPVAAHIRAGLPRFQHLDDTQILESSFKLMDAQELVARQLGFEGWQALKSGAHTMTTQSRQTASRPILSSTSAQLFVSDIKASCSFFTDKLGFAIDFVYGDHHSTGRLYVTKHSSHCGWSASRCLLTIYDNANICSPPQSRSTPQARSSDCSWISKPPEWIFTRRSRKSRGALEISLFWTRTEISYCLLVRPTEHILELNMVAISCYITGVQPPIPAQRFDNAVKLVIAAGMPIEDIAKTPSNKLADYYCVEHPPLQGHDALDDALSVAYALQHL